MKALVVEDEARLAELIRRHLKREGWSVDVVDNGVDAIWSATEFEFDVIVLDVGIPAPDGLEVCQILREKECWTPVLFLTARDGVEDRVSGLDSGGDDYLTKPFALTELAARMRALSRRTMGARPAVLQSSGVALDSASRSVTRNGITVSLTAKEFSILEILLRRSGEAVSRSVLFEHAWEVDFDGTSNVIDVHIRQLRDKIDRPFDTHLIETVRGTGYRFVDEPSVDEP